MTGRRPSIFISKDRKKMMEVWTHYADVYEQVPIEPANGKEDGWGPLVKWNKIYHIKRFPRLIQGLCSANFVFSPDFTYFIDVDFKIGNFVIRHSKDETIYKVIPRGMINLNIGNKGKSKVAI
jgi:hypothetical protein